MSEARFLPLVITFLFGSTTFAQAQELGGQRFTPAGSEDGVLGTEGSDLRRELYPYASLWLSYALDPVVIDGSADDASVAEHVLAADVVASMNLWKGLELGFLVPVTLFARGDRGAADQIGVPRVDGAAMGDLSVRIAYRFAIGSVDSIAIHVPILVPTGHDDDPLVLGFGVRPTLAYTHGFRAADLVMNLSYLYRDRVDVLDYQGGQELGLRVAARIGLDATWDTALLAEVGVSSSLHDFFGVAETPVEARLGIEHWFGEHIRLSGFAGAGLSRGVGAPDVRVGAGIAFGDKPRRPRLRPDQEDRDGDGVPNQDDQCPDEPETYDGITDDDGCPDRIRVEGSLIVTFEPVQFQTDSEVIRPESHAMLREIASVLEANPSMRIRVEGHSDSAGDDRHNMNLSRRRAQSVKRFLVESGASRGNIEAEGRGETEPIEDNDTPLGRRRNRRVEFHIAE